MWPSGPGVVGMSSSDSLGGMMGGQRGSGNIQRMAPGPAVMPVAPPRGPFDLNSAPFQVGLLILPEVIPVIKANNNALLFLEIS